MNNYSFQTIEQVWSNRMNFFVQIALLFSLLLLLSPSPIAIPVSATASASCSGNAIAPACETIGFAGNGRRYMINSTVEVSSVDAVDPSMLMNSRVVQRIDGFLTPCDCYLTCKSAFAAYQEATAAAAIGIAISNETTIDCGYWSFLPNTTFPSDNGVFASSEYTSWGNSSCFLFSVALANITVLQWNASAPVGGNDGVTPEDVSGSLMDGHPMSFTIASIALLDPFPIQWINSTDDCMMHLGLTVGLCSSFAFLTLLFILFKFSCGWRPPVWHHTMRTRTSCSWFFLKCMCRDSRTNGPINRVKFQCNMRVGLFSVVAFRLWILFYLSLNFSVVTFHTPSGNYVYFGSFGTRVNGGLGSYSNLYGSFGNPCSSLFPSDQVSNLGQCYLVQVVSGTSFALITLVMILYCIVIKMIYSGDLLFELTPTRRSLGPSLPPQIWAKQYEAAWKAMRLSEVAIALDACAILLIVLGPQLVVTFIVQRMNNMFSLAELDYPPYSVDLDDSIFGVFFLMLYLFPFSLLLHSMAHHVFLLVPVNDEPSPVLKTEIGREKVPCCILYSFACCCGWLVAIQTLLRRNPRPRQNMPPYQNLSLS